MEERVSILPRLNTLLALGPSLVLRVGFAYVGTSSEAYASELPTGAYRLLFQCWKSVDAFSCSFEVGFRCFLVFGLVASSLILSRSWKYLPFSRPVTRDKLWTVREYAESRNINRKVPFEYRPLDPSKAEIRLLRILPGYGDDEICINVIHASLRDMIRNMWLYRIHEDHLLRGIQSH